MKRTLSMCLLILFSAQFLTAQNIIRTPMGEILDDLVYFSSLHPRLEGSKQEKSAYLYIKSVIDELNVSYSEHNLGDLKDNHSFSSSIIVDIPGKRGDTLNIIVPIDHEPGLSADADGSVSLALGLSLVREFARRNPDISLRILFLGAEYSGREFSQLGSEEFLKEFYPESPQSFFYLDLKRIPGTISLRAGGEGIVAPYWQVRRAVSALESSGLNYLFKENENQIHRLGMWGSSTRINPYLQAGYPSLILQGDDYGSAPAIVPWITGFYSFIFDLIDNNKEGFPEQWDRHYLYFDFFGKPVSIGEQAYLFLLLTVIVAPLIYPFFIPRKFNRYLKTLGKNFWDIPVLLLLILLFLIIGTYGVQLILLIRGFPTLWQHTPLIVFLIKASIALILFFLFFGLLKKIRFSQNSTFYSSSALFMILLAILTVSVLDISMTYSLLWAFTFSFLFSIVPNKYTKAVMLAFSTLLVIKTLSNVFAQGADRVIEYLILSPFSGNMFLSLLILPFLLMLIRLDFLFRHPTLMRQKVLIRNAAIIFSSITMIGVLYLFGFNPYSKSNPQPVSVQEVVDTSTGQSRIRVSSPAEIEALILSSGDIGQKVISNTREENLLRQTDETYLDIDISLEKFLDRDRFLIFLNSQNTPESIEIRFSGNSDFLVYDIDFPYTLTADHMGAIVHIGHNPPLPLQFEAVFLSGTADTMKISAGYNGPFKDLGVLGAPYRITQTRTVNMDLPLPVE